VAGADVIVIHGTCDTAVHEQKSSTEMEMATSPPAAPTATFAGDAANVQLDACCVIVARSSPIVTTALRGDVLRFAEISYATVPGPCPLVELSWIQDALALAVH